MCLLLYDTSTYICIYIFYQILPFTLIRAGHGHLSDAILSGRASNTLKLRNRTSGCFHGYFYMCSRERKKPFLDFGREAGVLNCFYTGFVHVNTFHIVHHALNQFWVASQQLLVSPFMKLIKYKYLLFIRFFWYMFYYEDLSIVFSIMFPLHSDRR